MIFHKKTLVFVFIFFCLTLPILISVSAGALITGKTEITGQIPITAYDITVSGVDLNTATISWRTNTDANGTIEYGTTTTYGAFLTSELIGLTHTLSLYSLLPGTVYHYRVISDDHYGNHGVSGDLTFRTHSLPPTPTPTPTPGGGGGRPAGPIKIPEIVVTPFGQHTPVAGVEVTEVTGTGELAIVPVTADIPDMPNVIACVQTMLILGGALLLIVAAGAFLLRRKEGLDKGSQKKR